MVSKAFDGGLGQVIESKLFTIHLKSNMLNDRTTKIDQIDFNRVSNSLSQTFCGTKMGYKAGAVENEEKKWAEIGHKVSH